MFDFRQVDTCEDECDAQHENAQHGIGNGYVAALSAVVEQELSDNKCGKEASQTVERLREIQSAGRCLLRSQLGDVRIGCCLKECQSAADDEQGTQECIERAGLRAGDEQQGSHSEQ